MVQGALCWPLTRASWAQIIPYLQPVLQQTMRLLLVGTAAVFGLVGQPRTCTSLSQPLDPLQLPITSATEMPTSWSLAGVRRQSFLLAWVALLPAALFLSAMMNLSAHPGPGMQSAMVLSWAKAQVRAKTSVRWLRVRMLLGSQQHLATLSSTGVLVMESLEHALQRGANILCEYLGGRPSCTVCKNVCADATMAPCASGAVTCDAHHMTDPHPDGLGVSTCIELALKDANVDRDEVRTASVVNVRCQACPTLVAAR